MRYPAGYREAVDYMNVIAPKSSLVVLTSATEQQERSYIDTLHTVLQNQPTLNPIGDPALFPNDAIYISVDPESFAQASSAAHQAADPLFRERFQSLNGTPYPYVVSGLQVFSSDSQIEAILYLLERPSGPSSTAPLVLEAKMATRSDSDFNIDLSFPITSSTSVYRAESDMIEIIDSAR
jgi:hypothetical protein